MWSIKGWICGGYVAARGDGEMVFIYRRPDWGTGLSGSRPFFELRWRGSLIGRLSEEDSRRPRLRAEWLAEACRTLTEEDLLEIASAIKN